MTRGFLKIKLKQYIGEQMLGGDLYKEWAVHAADQEMNAYIKESEKFALADGVWIATDNYTITDNRTNKEEIILNLVVNDYRNMNPSGKIKDNRNVFVECDGEIIKPRKTGLREIGGDRKLPFIPCTFKMTNEDDKSFSVLAVCFNELAKTVASIEDTQPVHLAARVKKKRQGDSFELNVSRITFSNESTTE